MTLAEIKATVMHQTNNDLGDLEDFGPFLTGYINDGYDRLVYAYAREHPSENSEAYPLLRWDEDTPNIPARLHQSLADWATWMVYRNGNASKQQRGYAYRSAFDEALASVRAEGKHGKVSYFINIPK